MSNKSMKKSATKQAAKTPQKKTNILPFLAIAAVAVCVAVVFLVNGNNNSNEGSDTNLAVNGASIADSGGQVENNEANPGSGGEITIASGESLVIPKADITTDVSFYPVEVDGTNMEVIAVRDSAGNIRTAFNTCQVCYDSGRGYYVQSGDYLVCQNCGNRFARDQVEIESGGCNPWPIFDENKTVTKDEIAISYDFLVEAQGIFARWKGSY